MAYLGRQPNTGVRSRFIYTATASQTTFSGTDDDGKTLKYEDAAYLDVFLNGVLLKPVTDYTATSKTSVVLTSAAAASDIVEIVAYDIANIADTVSKANGGTFDAGVTVNGDLTVDTNTLYVDSANNKVGIGTTAPNNYYAKDLVIAAPDEGGVTVVSDPTHSAYLLFADGTSGADQYRGQIFYDHNVDRLGIATDGSTRLLIDSSGNLGINNTSPNTKIDVIGSTTNGSGIVDTIRLRNTGTTLNDGAKIQFTAGTSTSGAGIGSGGQALDSADLRFYSGGNTERMRLLTTGALLINATAYADVGLSISYPDSSGVYSRTGNTTSVYHYRFHNPNGLVGGILTSGSATSYQTSSDYRLKEDWQPMLGSIDRVKALNPVNFAWKIDGSRVDGFLAHEVADVVPEAIHGEKDAMKTQEYEVTPAVLDDDGNVVTEAVMGTREVPDYQGIDQSKLVPLLTAALQEAITKIEALEARLATLENA